MPQAFYILFGALFTGATALAAGRLLLRSLGVKLRRGEEGPLAFLTGSACLSLLVFLLAMAGLARKGVFLAAGVLILAIALKRGAHRPPSGEPLPPMPRFWRIVFLAIFAVFGAFYFVNAMAPEISPDGTTYHLGLVARYLREHRIPHITTHMYANLSQGVEMLFMFAYTFGRHSAAALVHFWFLLALPLAMLAWARRCRMPAVGVAGALFTFVSPVVGWDGSSAYNDVAVAAVLFGVFHLLHIWDEERQPAFLLPIGLLAGFAYAIKYTAFLAVPYAAGFVAWRLLRHGKPALRPLLTVSAGAAVMILPWALKNALWLHNPFSPFLNAWFPNPFVHISFEKEYAAYMRNYEGVTSVTQLPLELTVHGWALCGLLGPLFLLTPLALVALRRHAGRRLLFAGALFALTYAANVGTRFLIPALPFFSLALAMVFIEWKAVAATAVLAHAVTAWPQVTALYCHEHAWRLRRFPVRAALRLEPEEHYLTRHAANYLIARMLEDFVPKGERTLTFDQVPEAYTTRETLVWYQSAFGEVLNDIVTVARTEGQQPALGYRFRFGEQTVRKLRVVRAGPESTGMWSIAELRAYHAGKELPRAPEWRLTARPNPWDVQAAFDNSPVTRWRTWQPAAAGDFVEIDFGRPQPIDEIAIEAARDGDTPNIRLEAQTPKGAWQPLAAAAEPFPNLIPRRLRAMASDELKRNGIRYLLVHDRDYGAADFKEHAAEWRLAFVAERNGARLYRID